MTAVFHGVPTGGVHRIPRTSAPSGETSRTDSRSDSDPRVVIGEGPVAEAERSGSAEHHVVHVRTLRDGSLLAPSPRFPPA